jgi:hypothetical protein
MDGASAAAGGRVERYAAEGARVEVSFPRPGIARELCVGRGGIEGARFLLRALESNLPPSGRLTIFGDWEGIEGYDVAAKALVTEWTVRHRQRLASIHILVRSPFVSMSVSVSSLVTNVETVVYDSRDVFERAYAAACLRAAPAAGR